MTNKPTSIIEIPFYLRWLNPNCLMAWTRIARHDYTWFLDRSVSLKRFIRDVVKELKEECGLNESDEVVLRIRDKSDWQDELGLNKLMANVLEEN